MMRALLAAMLVLAATPARASSPICMQIDTLSQILRREHNEMPRASGAGENVQIVLFLTSDGSTWTLVALGDNGRACIAAMGTRWRALERST